MVAAMVQKTQKMKLCEAESSGAMLLMYAIKNQTS
jgi:hypothetical protein